jgi:phosphatidylinositol alpha-1,6-mannosyltransferase
VTHRIARHLRGAQVEVLTLDGPGATAFDRAQALDVRRVPVRAGARRLALALLNLRAVARALRFRPDVVLSGHIVTSPAASTLRRLKSIPFVQYVHSDEIRGRPHLAGFALCRADAVVAVSQHARSMALLAGAPPDRLHVIPNGVDLPAGRAGVRTAHPTIVTVARLRDRYKGHDVLVRAMPLILARAPDAEWVIVGDGPLRPELERLAADHGLSGRARFLGRISDSERDAWLERAHVFAMPSRLPESGIGGEGFGIVFLEASAHGLPVVAGNVAGAVDAVVDGETGLLVDPTDHVAVADAVSELLVDRARAEALGRAGAARAQGFAWPIIAEQVERLLLEVAGPTESTER